MIYLFDKQQNINGMLSKDDLIDGELNFKINNAVTFNFTVPLGKEFDNKKKYIAVQHPEQKEKYIMMKLMSRTDNNTSIDYTASELAYQELSSIGYIEDKRPPLSDAQTLMKLALDGSGWNLGTVNVTGSTNTNFYYISYLEAIQKVISLLGGEVYFYIMISGNEITGRYMDYVYQQGNDTSKVFANGSNLLTVKRSQKTSEIYTAILPRGKGELVSEGVGDSPDGYGRRIDISDVEWKKSSGDPLEKPIGEKILNDPDATAEWGNINGQYRLYNATFDDIDDVNVLIQTAYKTLMSINHPQIEYSATVADVGGISLGDTVLIMHNERNLNYKTRVFEVNYDLVSPENTTISLGDDLSSNSLTTQVNQISSSASTVSNQVQWNIANGGHNNTSFGPQQPANPNKGDVWYKALPNGNTEMYYYNGEIWVLGAETDQQWRENQAISQGSNTTFYGPDEPTGAVVGDVWFKNDNNEPDGKAMYTYSGSVWVKFDGSADASRLQIGTIDASKINVMNISADDIVTGTLSANFIKGGQLDFAQVNAININVNSLVGDTSSFIQSNWNGVYGSTSITSYGMTVNSGNSIAKFGALGMTVQGLAGKTNFFNGFMSTYSATNENIGIIGHTKDVDHDNVDYIVFGLNGYLTTNEGDEHWVGGSDFYGGDGMGFGVSNKKGTYDFKLRWDSDLIAGYKGEIQGWHASDQFIFDNKSFHKGYADFSGGVTVSGAYSEGTRSLHTQGMTINHSGATSNWFGWMDSNNQTGFGTEQTGDIFVFIKGQAYSMYTMLSKLGML